ncbi:MAG: hypothetical protein WC939_02825, partial [Acholeplasmataceae bacterium]
MKTIVRIQEYSYSEGKFNHKSFQILAKYFSNSEAVYPVGEITFQQTKGEDDWYGMRFLVNTSTVKELEAMTKIAKKIQKEIGSGTPDEVFKVIGGIEYKLYKQSFIPVSAEGQDLYDIIVNDGLYTVTFAKTEESAKK